MVRPLSFRHIWRALVSDVPSRQTPSTSVHGSEVRRPADLPTAGLAVRLELRVRRFCCRNPACSRHGLPGMAPSSCVEQGARVERVSVQARTGAVPCEFWSGTVIASMKAPNRATPP